MTSVQTRCGLAAALLSALLAASCSKDGIRTESRTCAGFGTIVEVGQPVPKGDGCNTCSCQSDGTFTCTTRACASDAGSDALADLATRTSCVDGEKTYALGESFKRDCNTCSCTSLGIACTLMACPPPAGAGGAFAGSGGAGGNPGSGGRSTGTGGAQPCFDGDRTYAIGETFKRDCNTCTCTSMGVACSLMACPTPADAATDLARAPDATATCVSGGRTYALGEAFSLDCNTCTCTAWGFACTARACLADASPDLGTGIDAGGTCSLSANLTFGHDGGNAIYGEVNRLTASTFTITRTYTARAERDGGSTTTCSPTLPACGTPGAVSIATVNADLGDPDVQSLWNLPQNPPPLFGTDPRPVDGTVYSIALDDGRKVLVGGQCASPAMSSCRTIPAGLLRLTNDLQRLATAMAGTPVCSGL